MNAETRGSFLQKINTFLGSNAVLYPCMSLYQKLMAAMLIKQLMCFNKQEMTSILMAKKKPFLCKRPSDLHPYILIVTDYYRALTLCLFKIENTQRKGGFRFPLKGNFSFFL